MVSLVSPLLPERFVLSLRSVSSRRSSLLCAGTALALALGDAVSPLPAAAQPSSESIDEFTVLQLNIWHQGTQVPEGIDRVADVIEETGADVKIGRASCRERQRRTARAESRRTRG